MSIFDLGEDKVDLPCISFNLYFSIDNIDLHNLSDCLEGGALNDFIKTKNHCSVRISYNHSGIIDLFSKGII